MTPHRIQIQVLHNGRVIDTIRRAPKINSHSITVRYQGENYVASPRPHSPLWGIQIPSNHSSGDQRDRPSVTL